MPLRLFVREIRERNHMHGLQRLQPRPGQSNQELQAGADLHGPCSRRRTSKRGALELETGSGGGEGIGSAEGIGSCGHNRKDSRLGHCVMYVKAASES